MSYLSRKTLTISYFLRKHYLSYHPCYGKPSSENPRHVIRPCHITLVTENPRHITLTCYGKPSHMLRKILIISHLLRKTLIISHLLRKTLIILYLLRNTLIISYLLRKTLIILLAKNPHPQVKRGLICKGRFIYDIIS